MCWNRVHESYCDLGAFLLQKILALIFNSFCIFNLITRSNSVLREPLANWIFMSQRDARHKDARMGFCSAVCLFFTRSKNNAHFSSLFLSRNLISKAFKLGFDKLHKTEFNFAVRVGATHKKFSFIIYCALQWPISCENYTRAFPRWENRFIFV